MGLYGFAASLGLPIPSGRHLKFGIIPIALAQETDGQVFGKDGLTVLNDRPLNMEIPPHLLDDRVTPANRFFVRNNGIPPEVDDAALKAWRLEIDGLVNKPLSLSLEDWKTQFKIVTLQLQVECGGNGRKFYTPGASGNQLTFGAIGCLGWTGVRLKDVLDHAGVKAEAIYTAHYGADSHLTGNPDKDFISRSVRIGKALDPHNLIAGQ